MAFDSLLRAWSSERTLYRDSVHCIVDKPAGVPCGLGPADQGVAPGDLRQRLARHGVGSLVSLLPLPQRASGATLLTFAAGESPVPGTGRLPASLHGLTYTIALDECRLPAQGQLKSPDGDAALRLEYRVARRQGSRALLEVSGRAAPEQVARAFAQKGQPIVGDNVEGAPVATRLMLHVSHIFGDVSATAPLPVEFESWLLGCAVLEPAHFSAALSGAGLSRFDLSPRYEAFRLLGEGSGEISGLTIDRYGDYAVVAISTEEAWGLKEQIGDCLMDHGARGVYLKRRVRTDLRAADESELAPPLPLRGVPVPESLYVRLGPVGVWVTLGGGLATGLFLDQRANWSRLFDTARGTSLLNLFSYTGAFTLAAAAGGAASTVSVDLAGRALARARQNLELNGLSGPQHRLFKDDVLSWLARARRAQRRFDCIVLDPPSFGTRSRGVLSTERDYAGLVAGALGLLEPRGRLLAVSHHRKISLAELAQRVEGACKSGGHRAKVEALVGGWDCPTLPGVSDTKSVLARLQ